MRVSAIVAGLAACLLAAPSFAEDAAPAAEAGKAAPCPPEERSHRELGGHFFMPSHLTLEPFSYTSFGTAIGLGVGQALGPTLDTSTLPPSLGPARWYNYNALGIQFMLDVRILEYLSISLASDAAAYLGSGSGSILVVGTGVNLAGTLAVKGSLPIGEHVRLALSVSARYGPTYTLLLLRPILDAIDACRANPNACTLPSDILQAGDTVTWTGALVGAWAPWAFLGVNLNFDYIRPSKTGSGSYAQNGIYLAGTVDFDAMPLVRWLPVGVNFGYAFATPVGASGVPTTTDWNFGLYYTGRKDMSVGLEFDFRSGKLNNNQTQTSTVSWVNFKYYW